MTNEYDVIIIGSGPNGLAIGAYLSRAGQRVLLIEKRFEAGGGLVTEQITLPDYYHNTHAIYKMMVDYAPVYKDFALEEKYGVKHIWPEVQVAMPFSDGRSLCIHRDVEKSCQSIAQFSQKDADMTELGSELAEYAEKTPEEIVCELFEEEHVRTLMLYMACHWGLEYDQTGVSYMVPIYLNRMANYRITAGGSHRVSNALLKSIFEHGGQIRTGAQIARIIMEGGEARGVELTDGTQYLADKAVVSTIDIKQTFVEYVGEDNLDPDLAGMIGMWEWEEWSLCNVHLALAEPPKFTAAEADPDVSRALIYVLGYESLDDLMAHWDAMRDGELPDGAGCNACFPSVHDPFQAPPGRATGLLSQMAPFELADGGSERWLKHPMREEIVQRQTALLQRYAPNLADGKVLWTYLTTPADIQNKFANMVHARRHPEQVRQHGEGKHQAGRVSAAPDGIPPAQPGLLPLPDTGGQALSRRRQRGSGRDGHLRSRLQLR